MIEKDAEPFTDLDFWVFLFPIHPAHQMPFEQLHRGLLDALAARLVHRRAGPNGLELFVYSDACVYERAWSPITLAARGLILDPKAGRIVATPFPKFFNLGETAEPLPDLPFEVFEKLDGSLIIIFHHAGRWRCATKGAFDSVQAQWAEAHLAQHRDLPLIPGHTYLAEYVGPDNRIVVRYRTAELVLLAAYDAQGREHHQASLGMVARALGWRCAGRHDFDSIAALVAHVGDLPADREGFVVRFRNGLRVKLKGAEYRRIHALITRCTPLAIWEAMAAGDDMDRMRRELPEEFWGDFDAITALLRDQIWWIVAETQAVALTLADLSDKEIGLRLPTLPPSVRPFIFSFRKQGGDLMQGRSLQALYRAVRPTGNRLDGYVASSAIGRVLDDAG